jgi:hypothetical protein
VSTVPSAAVSVAITVTWAWDSFPMLATTAWILRFLVAGNTSVVPSRPVGGGSVVAVTIATSCTDVPEVAARRVETNNVSSGASHAAGSASHCDAAGVAPRTFGSPSR